jgi:hypothetical protein
MGGRQEKEKEKKVLGFTQETNFRKEKIGER